MNTTSLIDLTAEETGLTKAQTEATVNAALKIICRTVASGKPVILPDFGTLKVRHILDRDEISPEAGDPISDVRVIKFLPSPTFRAEVNHRSN